jgi:hypothetical protein
MAGDRTYYYTLHQLALTNNNKNMQLVWRVVMVPIVIATRKQWKLRKSGADEGDSQGVATVDRLVFGEEDSERSRCDFLRRLRKEEILVQDDDGVST